MPSLHRKAKIVESFALVIEMSCNNTYLMCNILNWQFFSSAKGDPYAKVVIDKTGIKKTETAKKTWEPIWNEHFVL